MLNEIDLARADLNLLVLFEAVLAEKHVGRAADRLRLSPSAVSHGLGRLRRLLNDPLFLRTPKGVVPTARAEELAEPIAAILAQTRQVIAAADPFDPASSTRRFTLGAPDGVSAVFLPSLLARLRHSAPGVNIGARQLLPPQGKADADAWNPVLADLEARAIDIAVAPLAAIPPRFVSTLVHEEAFVIAMRAGHPFADAPSLDRYCQMQHLVVSMSGDAYGFIDAALTAHGRTRRVALTVPNFMMALALIAETDLITALPWRFAAMYGPRYGVIAREVPVALPHFEIRVIASKAAMMDAGVAWLYGMVQDAAAEAEEAAGRHPSA